MTDEKTIKEVVEAEPERLDLRSLDVVAEKTQELGRLFPEVLTEGGKIDFDKLRLALGEDIDVGKERYGLTWPGKAECFKAIQTVSLGTLLPCPEESVNWATTENLIIEGDNLEVMKLLQKAYLGKIKMIYIDPPYNTGNDFIYPDDYTESLQTYLQYTGQVDAEGKKFSTNTDTDGRFHSRWLNMMYPRLYLARNLLRDDGVIFISIDEGELPSLLRLGHEVFGESNFEGVICWRRRHNQPNDPTKMIGKVAEFIVAWARDSAALKATGVGKIPLTGDFSNPDSDPRGEWASKPWKVGKGQSGSRYQIVNPTGMVLDEEWMGDKTTYERLLNEGRIYFPNGTTGLPRKKYYRSEREAEGQSATNWWPHDAFGSNQEATNELAALFDGSRVFDNPKPSRLLAGLLRVGDSSRKGIILDFFAGSGTLAHAVFDTNRSDDARRRFVLVQLPEPTDRTDYPSIADLLKERVRRAGRTAAERVGVPQDEAGPKDEGFRVFKLDESNLTTWDATAIEDAESLLEQMTLHQDHVREARTDDDLLFELLIKSGFALTTTIEKLSLAKGSTYSVAGGALVLCLARVVTQEIVDDIANLDPTPERVVFLDEGFAGNDQLKVNALETFRTRGVPSFRTV